MSVAEVVPNIAIRVPNAPMLPLQRILTLNEVQERGLGPGMAREWIGRAVRFLEVVTGPRVVGTVKLSTVEERHPPPFRDHFEYGTS
jgi:hypothetical protein